MKTIKRFVFAAAACLATGPSPMATAQELMDYDAIVEELGGNSRARLGDPDPFASVLIHASVGFTTALLELEPETGASTSGLLNGAEASIGIDLFSRSWAAEGALRSFNSGRMDSETSASLKEFDLKVNHTTFLTSRLRLLLGGGLAARYLTVESPYARKTEYTTPASILSLGLRVQLSRVVGVGIDTSLRTSLIDDSIDRSGVNGSLRLNAAF